MMYQSHDQMHVQATEIQTPAPGLPTTRIRGLDFVTAKADPVAEHLLRGGPKTVCFVNAHCVNTRDATAAYRAAVSRADHILPDGIGVELAGRMEGKRLAANLNGTDFVPLLLRKAARSGRSVFLLGGAPGTAQKAAARLCTDIPGLRVVGTRDGFDGMTCDRTTVADLNAARPDIVLVALGVPRQELWIDAHRDQIDAPLVMGVGALFDFLAGSVQRAPKALRTARLEWLWRLAMEPRRLAKRYVLGNGVFLARSAAHALGQRDRQSAAQRGLDIAVSGLAMALLAVPMLIVAGLIRLESKGPALFKQTRVGKDGVPFAVYKFRSMHGDAEARRAALLAQSDREGVCFKAKNDPRITRIGKGLRRLSIDELPQILNVLKGDMSIVGPRPALPEEVAAYPQRALARLGVRPGITGLWQVSGRANIGFDKMIDMDCAYVRSRSLLLDVILIALTFRAVVSGRGAY